VYGAVSNHKKTEKSVITMFIANPLVKTLKQPRQHSNDKYKHNYPDAYFHGEPPVETDLKCLLKNISDTY
jgi:hypothetical protein